MVPQIAAIRDLHVFVGARIAKKLPFVFFHDAYDGVAHAIDQNLFAERILFTEERTRKIPADYCDVRTVHSLCFVEETAFSDTEIVDMFRFWKGAAILDAAHFFVLVAGIGNDRRSRRNTWEDIHGNQLDRRTLLTDRHGVLKRQRLASPFFRSQAARAK